MGYAQGRSRVMVQGAIWLRRGQQLLQKSGPLSHGRRSPRLRVFLTALGGGAFGNRDEWVADAMTSALEKFRDTPLDVMLVHFGSIVQGKWAKSVRAPTPSSTSTEVKRNTARSVT